MDSSTAPRWQQLRWAAVLVGFVASALLVWQASYAAFSATTSNAGNTWSSGTVSLADDDSNSAMFAAGGLAPGDTSTRCLQVQYTGSLAATVKLYGAVTPGTPDLGPYLQLKVEQGTGGTFAGCTGFTPDATTPVLFDGTLEGGTTPFAAADWSTGLTTAFAPVAGSATAQVYSFRVTTTLDPNAPNAVQGGGVQAQFTWEAQS